MLTKNFTEERKLTWNFKPELAPERVIMEIPNVNYEARPKIGGWTDTISDTVKQVYYAFNELKANRMLPGEVNDLEKLYDILEFFARNLSFKDEVIWHNEEKKKPGLKIPLLFYEAEAELSFKREEKFFLGRRTQLDPTKRDIPTGLLIEVNFLYTYLDEERSVQLNRRITGRFATWRQWGWIEEFGS